MKRIPSPIKYLLLIAYAIAVYNFLLWQFTPEETILTTPLEVTRTTIEEEVDEQFDVEEMTEEEKEEAMEELLEQFPPEEMTDEERAAEEAAVQEMLEKVEAATPTPVEPIVEEAAVAEPPVVAEPVVVEEPEPTITEVSAKFVGDAHPTKGTATIINDNGHRVLVFNAGFKSDPGPNLHVFLSGTAAPSNSKQLHENGDVDLGKLKSTNGVQMYEIPDSVDFDINSVVIYCVPFKVIFGTATF